MIDVFNTEQRSVIAVAHRTRSDSCSYGIIKGELSGGACTA
jgi:UTP-glucose-1-phosphate uridylyltransferase